MATIDDKAFIDKLIAGNGRVDQEEAPDNAYVIKIIEYTTYEGRTAWGIVFATDARVPVMRGATRFVDRYEEETEYVRNPRVIWRRT